MTNQLTEQVFWDDKYSTKRRFKASWIRKKAHRKFDSLLCQFMDRVGKPTADILELGCAPGRLLERLHALRPQHRFHGIDYSRVGIEKTHAYLAEAGVEANVYEGDIRTFELPGQCDLTVSFGLIEHFEDPVPILCRHIQFCRPGGYVGVTVPNFRTPVNRFLMSMFDRPGVAAHYFRIMTVPAIKAALEDAGLEEIEVGGCDGPRIFPGGDRRRRISRIYRRVARGWNLGVAMLPIDVAWQYTIWGCGRVPLKKSENSV